MIPLSLFKKFMFKILFFDFFLNMSPYIELNSMMLTKIFIHSQFFIILFLIMDKIK